MKMKNRKMKRKDISLLLEEIKESQSRLIWELFVAGLQTAGTIITEQVDMQKQLTNIKKELREIKEASKPLEECSVYTCDYRKAYYKAAGEKQKAIIPSETENEVDKGPYDLSGDKHFIDLSSFAKWVIDEFNVILTQDQMEGLKKHGIVK